MALKDWKKIGHQEYRNDKKQLVIDISSVYNKFVVNVYSNKKERTIFQKVTVNKNVAKHTMIAYMRKH